MTSTLDQTPRQGGAASIDLRDYAFLRHLTRARLAWEYLRRNLDYRRDWRVYGRGGPSPTYLKGGTKVLRQRRGAPRARAWGLYSFRQS